MNAGKELDLLISEKVMEIAWDEKRCRICGWPLQSSVKQGCVVENCALRPPPAKRADTPAPYSTDFNAALLVAEKADLFHGRALGRKANGWFIFEDEQGGGPVIVEDVTTIPLAICMAALKLSDLKENPPPLAQNIVHLVCGTHPERCPVCKEPVCPKCYPDHAASCEVQP